MNVRNQKEYWKFLINASLDRFRGHITFLNDKEINLVFQNQMRKRVREHVLNTRKADHVTGIDREVPNLTLRQLIDFSADSLRCVSTEKYINSFKKCDFVESDKWTPSFETWWRTRILLTTYPNNITAHMIILGSSQCRQNLCLPFCLQLLQHRIYKQIF